MKFRRRRNYWIEAYRAPVTFYCGLTCSGWWNWLRLMISLGEQNFITIGPFTVGVDFDFG